MPFPYPTDGDPTEADMLRQHDRLTRRYQRRLADHPDPRDPDYPGDVDDEPEDQEN